MTTAVFDTLKASRKLKAVGIEEAHAEAIVQSMAEAFEDTVATKSDLAKLEASVKSDMDLLKADMLVAFSNTVNRILLAQLVVAGLLFAALKLF